jgi:tRNA(Ile)-lysidine synthase
MRFARPFLDVPAPALRGWLQQSGVAWVQDPTNDDPQRTRNRIRHTLLPALEAAFPQFRQTFGRAARHAAQAHDLLSAMAQRDLLDMGGELSIAALQGLEPERQTNLMRHWLRSVHGAQASAAQLDEWVAQVDACRTRGHHIRIKVGAGLVERQGDRLVFVTLK